MKKRILLIAQNSVAADYIKDVYNLLKNDGNISQFVTTDWYPPRNFNKDDIAKVVKAKYIHILHGGQQETVHE